MAKAFIRFYSKTSSLIDERSIDTEIIPRVGEIIDAGQFLDFAEGTTRTFIVSSVIYKLTSEGFVPHITAAQWHKGLRSHLLQSRGWILPELPDMLAHDEDDASRADVLGLE